MRKCRTHFRTESILIHLFFGCVLSCFINALNLLLCAEFFVFVVFRVCFSFDLNHSNDKQAMRKSNSFRVELLFFFVVFRFGPVFD